MFVPNHIGTVYLNIVRNISEPGKFRAHIMENFWSSIKNRINELNQDDVTVDREPDATEKLLRVDYNCFNVWY